MPRFRSSTLGQRGPLSIRVGPVDILVPVNDLVSLERKTNLAFEVTRDWFGKRRILQGDVEAPENSYGKYSILGLSSDNEAVTSPIAKLKLLALAQPRTPLAQVRPLSFPTTIELSNGTRIAVAELKRVSHSSLYSYHFESFVYKKGSAEVDAPLNLLAVRS